VNLYEGMFLLDNQAVRADWRKAKSLVTGTLEKHGAKVNTARRWDERKLAYEIKGRMRGTYLLSYYEVDTQGIDGLRRDLELSEQVLRYMLLRVEEVPAGEQALHEAELDESFEIPLPPEDDAPEEAATATAEEESDDSEAKGSGDEDGDDEDSEDDSAEARKPAARKPAARKPAAKEPAASKPEAAASPDETSADDDAPASGGEKEE
jgi:small subunit ribosomal protein S6